MHSEWLQDIGSVEINHNSITEILTIMREFSLYRLCNNYNNINTNNINTNNNNNLLFMRKFTKARAVSSLQTSPHRSYLTRPHPHDVRRKAIIISNCNCNENNKYTDDKIFFKN